MTDRPTGQKHTIPAEQLGSACGAAAPITDAVITFVERPRALTEEQRRLLLETEREAAKLIIGLLPIA